MARSPSSTRVPRSSVAARLSEIVPPARPALTGRLVSRAPSQATLSSFSGTSVSVRRLGSAQAATSCVTRALASSTAPAAFGAPSVPLRTNAPLLGPAIPASRAGAGRPPARPAARAPGAARAARFHAPAEARDVQHAFGVPDQRDGRLLERQVGELDVAHEERPELQREAAALELEEGGGAELRVLAHLEVGELERGPREERDGHGGELHGPADRLRRGRDYQRLDARRVDQVREGHGRGDHEEDDRRGDAGAPRPGALQRAPSAPVKRSGWPTDARASGRPGA